MHVQKLIIVTSVISSYLLFVAFYLQLSKIIWDAKKCEANKNQRLKSLQLWLEKHPLNFYVPLKKTFKYMVSYA